MIKRIREYQKTLNVSGRYQRYLILLIFINAASMIFSLINPLVLKRLIDNVFSSSGDIDKNVGINILNYWLAVLVIVFAISAVATYLSQYISGKLSATISDDIRSDLFKEINLKRLAAIYKIKSGDIVSRIMNDVVLSQELISTYVVRLISGIMGLILPLVIMLTLKWDLALICIMPTIFYSVISWIYGNLLRDKQKRVLQATGNITSFLTESLSIMPLVKVFCLEDYQKGRFASVGSLYRDASIDMSKTIASYISISSLNFFVPILLLLWVGGRMTLEGTITIGTLVAFSTYVTQFFGPIRDLSNLWPNIKRSEAAFERLKEIVDLDLENEIHNREGLVVTQGKIVVKDLAYSYNNEQIFDNFNVTFDRGLNFLIGDNGSGKSTLLHLISSIYKPHSGRIEIDGKDISEVNIKSLRKNISILLQNVQLIDATIYENISIGDLNAMEEEVIEAARLANAHEFIIKLPQGYHTQVGENGMKLSGGERQKIALARAALRKSRIMLLDEVTSSIDEKSKKSIYAALSNLSKDRTIIIATHELPQGIKGGIFDLNDLRVQPSQTATAHLAPSPGEFGPKRRE